MSDSENESTIEVKGLDDLIKALGAPLPVIRVGVLSGKATRDSEKGSHANNAEIGAFHEFGTEHLPIRSFLRVPLGNHLDKAVEEAGAIGPDTLEEITQAKSLLPLAEKLGIIAEGVVLEGFDTGGYGEWQPSNMTHKQNAQTLVETHQLRDSITHDVKVGAA